MEKRTKIVATIGPASNSLEMIEKLFLAGVNVFRLNFSHGTHAQHLQVLEYIREVQKKTTSFIGILQDISGPKIRIGKLDAPFELVCGDIIEFVQEKIVGYKVTNNTYKTCLNQPDILSQLKVGESVYLYDGTIRTEVVEVNAASVTVCVHNSGVLTSKKGVNFPNVTLGIDVLTPKDKEDILWGIKHDVDFMAISFVQNADDMIQVRKIIENNNGHVQLFAKIENVDAAKNIDSILKESDGIMVARGDLGIEIPYYDVPALQKELIKKANQASKPVITATQMLLSITTNETATRAEISDIANAVLDGTDAVMLSEESAIGKHPIVAVQTMVKTIQGAEKVYPFNKFSTFTMYDATDSINEAAVRLSHDIAAKGLIAVSSLGLSVKKLSRYRPKKDIYAVVNNAKVAKLLTICWGVTPAFLVKEGSLSQMMSEAMTQGLDRNIIDLSKSYILTAGDPAGVTGTTNTIRILRKNEMEFFKSL